MERALWEGLDKANPKDFPTFRERGVHDSLRYPDANQIKLDLSVWDEAGKRRCPRIFLPKVGWVKFRKTLKIAAMDLGVSNLITLPDGTVFDPVSPLRRFEEKLAWEQRKLSRKKQFSRAERSRQIGSQ